MGSFGSYISRMVEQRYRRFITNGTVRSDFVIVLEPSFNFSTCVVKAHEPVGVQTFRSELAIEAFNERIVSRFAWSREVQGNTTMISPQIKIAGDELATLISHPLCPFVQRAVIVLLEKQVPFERINVDLSAKPAWFLAISPTGKVALP